MDASSRRAGTRPAGSLVKYSAELDHVRELSLFGSADLGFWEERLAREGLVPIAAGGGAGILIIAAEARFLGLSFRELSFSVRAAEPGSDRVEGAFLVQAFQSRRAFAFCERVFFSTPYAHGAVRIATEPPAVIELARRGRAVFRAAMHGEDAAAARRQPSRRGEDGWEGPVYLPGGSGARRDGERRSGGKVFFARIRGETLAFDFVPATDSLVLGPAPDLPVLRDLVDSAFVPREWIVRKDALHAKSRTFRRAAGIERWMRRPRAKE